jgi:MEMO1 family protein
MDRPRLRPLEAFPIDENGQKFLALRDPSGLSEHVARLPPLAVAILQLCDGETTRDEICAEFTRRYKAPLGRDQLDKLLKQLDDAMLLDSESFRQHSARVFGEFASAATRPAAMAGKSYPAEADALRELLDSFYDPPNGPGRPGAPSRPLPRAIVAPHIDFQRGRAAYAWAYKPLAEAETLPELVVIFGTDHNGIEQPFTLTRKHYQTPFGQMTTDVALVDALTDAVKARDGEKAAAELYYDEHHHRGEHSLEFQMVWLRHVWGARADAVKVLPILCGSLQPLIDANRPPAEELRVANFLAALGRVVEGRRVLWIAGADLAHVGPRFGDQDALDAGDRGSLERRDRATLDAAARGDAAGWFAELAREKDRRRVCGLPPIYAMLETARPGAGELLAYAQCPADEKGGSLVSIASLVWR